MKFTKALFIAALLWGLVINANSQSNNNFCSTIGGAENDFACGLSNTNDNGSIICGYTNSFGQGLEDCYFVKLDSVGQIEWTKTIGGTNVDKAFSIVQTSDGGFAFTGITQSFGAGGNDVYIGKLTSIGGLSWIKTLGGASSDYGNSIIETSDGGLAIAGWYGVTGIDYDAYLIKMDALGNIIFSNTYGGSGEDVAHSVCQNVDGSYILSGYSKSFGSGQSDCYVLNISNEGSLIWSNTIGGQLDEEAFSIIQTNDNGFAFVGRTQSYGAGGNDCYLVKLNASGDISWTKTIGGLNSDYFKSLKQNSNGNLFAGGWYGINAGNYDLYFAEFDYLGSFISGKTVGSIGIETGQGIIITNNNCIMIAGYSDNLGSGQTDMYIVQFDSLNNICTSCNPANSVGVFDMGGELSTGGVEATAGSTSSGGIISSGGAMTLICQNISTSVQENTKNELFSVYPNPAISQINLRTDENLFGALYNVFDNTGKVVLSGKMNAYDTVIEIGSLSCGIYLFSVGENLKQTFKIIKE